MSQPSIIVTGGAGLIGANLVAALNQRGIRDILVVDHLDHPAKKANLGRIEWAAYLEKDAFRTALQAGRIAPPKTLFHLGACSSTTEADVAYLADNNTACTRELCDWSLRHGVRFIYASSAATYGDGASGYDDADALLPRLQPLNPYGWSKQHFDRWALDAGRLASMVGLKYFNVFGPGEDHKGAMRSVVHKAHEQIEATGVLKLFRSHRPEYRDGEQQRDFVSVADAVRTTLYFHDHPEVHGLFNCGTGLARTWLDLAEAIFAAMGREPRVEFIDMPAELRDTYQYHTEACTGKLRAAGAPVPATPLETAVGDYVRGWLALPEDQRRFEAAGGPR